MDEEIQNPALKAFAETLTQEAPAAPEATTVENPASPEAVTPPVNPENPQAPAAPEAPQPPVEQVTPEWWEAPENPAAPVAPTAPATEAKPEPVTQKPVSVLDEDPDLKLLYEYKKGGKTLVDFVKDYSVEDVSTLSPKELVEKGMKEIYGLNGEELEEAMTQYDAESIITKRQLETTLRTQLDLKREAKLKELTAHSEKVNEKATMVLDRFNNELTQAVDQIKGKEMYGITITDEMSSELSEFSRNLTLVREDGSFDVHRLLNLVLLERYIKDIVKVNVTKSKNKGREEILAQVTNPSPVTSPTGPKGSVDEADEAVKSYLEDRRKAQL